MVDVRQLLFDDRFDSGLNVGQPNAFLQDDLGSGDQGLLIGLPIWLHSQT